MVMYRYIVVLVFVVARSLADEAHQQEQHTEHSRLRDSKHVHDKE